MGEVDAQGEQVLGRRMSPVTRVGHADGVDRSYSAATIHNGVVYPCGQIPVSPDGSTPVDIAAQTRQCLENLELALRRSGSSVHQLLQVTVYLSRIDEFEAYDQAWLQFFESIPRPPRTTLFVAGFRGVKRIELTASAALLEGVDEHE